MGVKKVAKKGVDTATGFAHQKVHQVEKDNSGVEAAHKSEEAAERLHHFVKGRKKPKDKSARAEKRGGEDQKWIKTGSPQPKLCKVMSFFSIMSFYVNSFL